MSFIKNIFSLNPKYYVLYLLGAISIILIVFPCFGVETGHSEPIFSLTVKNQPLIQALNNISRITGYKITVSKGWGNRQLTADLQDVTLEEGLKKIIRLIGNPNHTIVNDEKGKSIDIRIYDEGSGYSGTVTSGISSGTNQVDPLDLEVIPPENEGEKGITEREFKAMQAKQKDAAPSEIESFPPDDLK
jgi:hypothetical protein